MENLKFCYTKGFPISKTGIGRSSAVAYKSKYWGKDHNLKIYFINGSAEQVMNAVDVIEEILDPLSLTVTYVSYIEDSEIRIAFDYGYGSWSYLGTDALFIPKNETTLNIGWEGDDVIRHEFCHALGMLHEHQNPKEGINWNEERVIEDLSGHPNYWTEDQIRHNVLNKVDINDVDATDFDRDSIMLYYFPSYWTLDGFSTNDNPVLSDTDKQFLLKRYGPLEQDDILPVITLLGDSYETVPYGSKYSEKGAEAKDNVDGDISEHIMIEGRIDTLVSGLQYLHYTVKDSSGNVGEAIRTVLVEEEEKSGCLIPFLGNLFSSRYRLGKLTEAQLVYMANELGIDASTDDLKADTLIKVWEKIRNF